MIKSFTSKKGVTVMEMLVVLVIIGMLSLMAMPTFFAFTKNARLKGASRVISSALRNARSYAITQRINYIVSIYLIDNAVTIYETPDSAKKVKVSDTDIIDIRYSNGTNPAAKTIEVVTFNPDGTASSTFSNDIPVGSGTDNGLRVYDPAGVHYIEIKVYSATGSVKTGDIDQDI